MDRIKNPAGLPKEPLPKSGKNEAGSAVQPEIGGRKGPEPTRYGDWENKGKCVDF